MPLSINLTTHLENKQLTRISQQKSDPQFSKKNLSLFAKGWWPSRAYSMKLKMKLNVSYGFICFKICYSWCSHFFVSKVIVRWIQTTVSEFDSLKIEMLMWMHFFIVRRFLHVLLKSLLWLYFLEYRNQMWTWMNMNPWKYQIDVILILFEK